MKMIVPVRLSVRRRVREPGVARAQVISWYELQSEQQARPGVHLDALHPRTSTSTARRRITHSLLLPSTSTSSTTNNPPLYTYTLPYRPSASKSHTTSALRPTTPQKIFREPNTWLLYVYPLRSYHSQRHRSFTNLNGHAASFSAARLLASIHPERRHPAFRSCPRGQASRP